MMRYLTLFLFFFLLPNTTICLPSLQGGRGLLRVSDARTEGAGILAFSLHPLFRWGKTTDSSYYASDLLAPTISYAPTDFLEFFASTGGVFQFATDISAKTDTFVMGRHNVNLGGKASLPLIPVFKPGLALTYNFPRDTGTDKSFFTREIPNRQGVGLEGLVTFKFSEIFATSPNLLFNYGVAKLVNKEKIKKIGLGLEIQAKNLGFFIEATSEQKFRKSLLDDSGFVQVTPGFRFIGPGTGLDLGLGFGLSDVVPKYSIILGFSFAAPFLKPQPVPFGTIVGKVVDSRTGAPLPANITITFPNNPKLKPFVLTSDTNSGLFTQEKIPPGIVLVTVESEGYYKEVIPITIKGDVITNYDFTLKSLVTYGVVSGRVYDMTTNQPLKATIAFPGTAIPPIITDSMTGAFRVDNVPTGIISIEAEKEGYFKNSLTAQVEEGKVREVSFGLAPKFFKSVLTGKVSDKKTGKGIFAKISFPGTEFSEVNTDSLTGIYRVELPVGSHPALIKAEDYISQSAVVILEKDKITEKNFELVKKGMVITLRGVYFDFNKATIKPESYSVLDDAVKILKDNPKIMVEIQGHTDNIGPDDYNQKLSEKRAYAVVDYFVKTGGIDIKRLKAVGYGEGKPIASNANESGRSLNRRVEFVVLGEMEE